MCGTITESDIVASARAELPCPFSGCIADGCDATLFWHNGLLLVRVANVGLPNKKPGHSTIISDARALQRAMSQVLARH